MLILVAFLFLGPFHAWGKSIFEPLHGRQGDCKAEIPLSAQYIELMKVSC